jgi:hypothetical protein
MVINNVGVNGEPVVDIFHVILGNAIGKNRESHPE